MDPTPIIPAREQAANPDFLAGLCSRYSQGVKHLGEPGPSDADLDRMVAAALRGPDHGALVPWRLAMVRGQARWRLAQCFAEHAREKGKVEADVQIERDRALKAPLTVAVLARTSTTTMFSCCRAMVSVAGRSVRCATATARCWQKAWACARRMR